MTLEGARPPGPPDDFDRFDLIVAMDRENLRELRALAPDDGARAKVRLLRGATRRRRRDVPDPYYGGDRGFETVLDMVGAACRELLDELRAADRA